MKRQGSHYDFSSLEKLAAASGRGTADNSVHDSTTRQKKHEMLLTFMANTNPQPRRSAPVRPRLLSTLLSLFF